MKRRSGDLATTSTQSPPNPQERVETTRGRGGGTVVTRRARGSFARKAARVSAEQRVDWLDALEFRRVVEPGAAAQAAAANLADDDLARLRAAHDTVATSSRPAEHRQADSRFHLTVAALTGSARIIAAAWEQDDEWGTLVWLVMVTGMRRGEVLALRWSDADLIAGMLAIRRNYVRSQARGIEKDTKTHQMRRISLDPQTVAVLSDHRARYE